MSTYDINRYDFRVNAFQDGSFTIDSLQETINDVIQKADGFMDLMKMLEELDNEEDDNN